jgi:predicted metal-binding membrane protein
MDGMHMHGGAASGGAGAGSLPGAAASFLVMWVVMTAAMMLPSMAPTLWRYRRALARAGETYPSALAALAALAYLVVWTALGALAFLVGVALAGAQARWPELARAAPIAAGVVVLLAGGVQLTEWKARRLGACRAMPDAARRTRAHAISPWRHGLRLGRDCALSCAGLMVSVLVVGATDVRAMAVVTVAITAERLARAGDRVARGIGVAAIVVGSVLIARGVGLG